MRYKSINTGLLRPRHISTNFVLALIGISRIHSYRAFATKRTPCSTRGGPWKWQNESLKSPFWNLTKYLHKNTCGAPYSMGIPTPCHGDSHRHPMGYPVGHTGALAVFKFMNCCWRSGLQKHVKFRSKSMTWVSPLSAAGFLWNRKNTALPGWSYGLRIPEGSSGLSGFLRIPKDS